MNLDLWPLAGEGWVCAPACPVLLAFLSIFPQLSVSEMESSALSMKHISAEFQGGVYHKIFFCSETCWVAVWAVSLLWVMNEVPFFFFSSPLCFCLHLVGGIVLFDQYTLLFPTYWYLPLTRWGYIKGFTCLSSLLSTPLDTFPQRQDSRSFLETLVFCETDLILNYKWRFE